MKQLVSCQSKQKTIYVLKIAGKHTLIIHSKTLYIF